MVRNAAALYVVHFSGMVLPLVTLPFLARVLEPASWGRLLVAQSLAVGLSTVLEFGFGYSASRLVSRERESADGLARAVRGVLAGRILLLVPFLAVVIAAGLVVPAFRGDLPLLLLTALSACAMGFSPFWYFQGTERMTRAVTFELMSRVATTAAVFAVIRTPLDGWKVIGLQALGGILSSGVPMVWMYREARWMKPSIGSGLEALRGGAHMFVYRLASMATSGINALILGMFVPPAVVGHFGGGEKIALALVAVTGPATQAIYPRAARLYVTDRVAAGRLVRATFGLLVTGATIAAILASLVAAPAVHVVLGGRYDASVSVLRILLLMLPLRTISNICGMQWLFPAGRERAVTAAVVIAALLNLGTASVLATRWGAEGMAWSVAISEAALATILSLLALRLARNMA